MGTTTSESRHREELTPQASAPEVPTSFDDLGIPKVVLENLLIKQLAAFPKSDILQLTKLLGVNSHLIEDLIAILRKKSLVEVFQAASETFLSQNTSGHVRYALSEQGMQEADIAFAKDAYLGPAPVSLRDYQQMVGAQDVRAQTVTKQDVTYALSDVYGAERMIGVLGPAINSGRALLLYGDAGTGKTFVATRILNSLNTSVYVPYAVYAAGNIIKVFSPQHHRKVNTGDESISITFKDQHDRRWVLCERPSIQVGGELTMDMLEVNHTEHNRVWMAPLQMMANNGIFIIDDLGRQPMPVDTLLNRWIVPMEYFYDYLSLPNGQQITIPFILTLAFSSNLDPQKIADPAFLRRLGYKIQFYALKENEYHALWEKIAQGRGLSIELDTFDKLFGLHRQHTVGYYPCLPKDIVGISRDIIAFEEVEPVITPEILARAWEVYFTADGKGGGER
ncbi:AAA family ATPase [Vibrio sp. SCSIO 43135]|uniref:AAA family ATPase n=1 Tax=Vibrio paucivorans TaxID=2829489 RepID=A0A9X3CF40_9VIBR|nr:MULTISPECIES: AAA family ATPase [Vibrio]MCW8334561.1 AAA family ATPase [Vibrio paucivorans]USD40634.1 AAA family ATPase [Vibrio sp. SCSIO 43135]